MKVQFTADFHADDFTEDRPLPWPKIYDISEDGMAELMSLEALDGVGWKICSIVAVGKFYGSYPKSKNLTRALKQARDALTQFREAMTSAGPWLTRKVLSDHNWQENENLGNDYALANEDCAFRLERFITDAETYEKILKNVADSEYPSSGRDTKQAARVPAKHLAELFRDHGIEMSTYQDGTFMQALRIILREIDPQIGDEAYRRHGQWAIRATQPIGTK